MHKNQGWGMAVAVLIFWMNLRAMAPTITAGDSAELSTAQTSLGIAHSPGYPFFVLTGKIFSTLMPFGNPSYRTNLFSVCLSFFIALFLYQTIFLWTQSVWLSVSAPLFFLFVPAIREQFLSTEVFALNMLAVVVILFLVSMMMLQRGGLKSFYLIAFILGLGMGNQHTLILLLPALIFILTSFYFPFNTPRASHTPLNRVDKGEYKGIIHYLLFFILFFVLGLSIYLFLPIRSLQQPLLDWEDPQTFERFWGVITRARYGMFQLAQGASAELSISRLMAKTLFFFKELYLQMTLIAAVLVLLGSLLAFFREEFRKIGFALALFTFLSGPFFLMLSNVSTGAVGRDIVSRFLPMPFLGFFVLGVVGCSHKRVNFLLALLLFLSFLSAPSAHSLRNHFLVRDYGKNVLRTLPMDSLLFADRADEIEFSLAYFLYSEGRRKDIEFVDCNAGVTRSIYGEDYYRIWGKPRLAIRELKEREMIGKSEVPVFYATVEPEMIAIPRKAEGILFRAKPSGLAMRTQWDEFYTLRYNLTHPGFRGVPLASSYAQLMGKYFLAAGLSDIAEYFFRMLAHAEPTGAWNHSIALWCFEKGENKLAGKFFLKAVLHDSEKDKVLCNLGILYERTGRMVEAEESYKKAGRANPQSFQAHYNLGVLYWKQNRWQEVIKEFETVLKIHPQHLDAQKHLRVARQRIKVL